VEIIFFDPISKHKARNAIICGLNGSKVGERVVLKNYVAIGVWEVCMPNAITINVHQIQHFNEALVEIKVEIVVFWSIKFPKLFYG
jgi:hypothetical protein